MTHAYAVVLKRYESRSDNSSFRDGAENDGGLPFHIQISPACIACYDVAGLSRLKRAFCSSESAL